MANYATLKAAIQNVVKTNGNNEITGALLQQTLFAMVNSLGANYNYVGIAEPSTNPGTPDQNVFYIATTAGTYTNFGGLSVASGTIAILKYNGQWAMDGINVVTAEQLNDLRDTINQQLDEKVQAVIVLGVNRFDKSSNNLYNGYGGLNGYVSNNSYRMTHPIRVVAGTTYKWPTIAALGTSQRGAYCTEDGAFISSFPVTTSGGFCTWTATEDGFVRVNIGTAASVDAFMFCSQNLYPSTYVAFNDTYTIGDEYHLGQTQIDEITEILEPIEETISEFENISNNFVYNEGINRFNKDDEKIKHGYYNSSGNYVSASSYFVTGPIPVKRGITYKALHYSSLGAANNIVAIVDSDNNKIGTIYGTLADGFITFTPTADCLVSLNGAANGNMATFMVCVATEYPSNYIQYIPPYTILDQDATPNPLTGKSVIFTGDSICAAPNDDAGMGGWAKRIGVKNHMEWDNKAVSGATITDKNLTGGSFTISDTDFGNGADYIILEGGTNDADRIGSILGGTLPELYGSFNETDYLTSFANSTFCSAVERLIQRVVAGFPNARVGFIIAPKMGVTSNGYTKNVNNRRAYFETIINICHKWGVPVLNLWDECTMNPRLLAHYNPDTHGPLYYDGQHPVAAGYELITPIIEQWMKGL